MFLYLDFIICLFKACETAPEARREKYFGRSGTDSTATDEMFYSTKHMGPYHKFLFHRFDTSGYLGNFGRNCCLALVIEFNGEGFYNFF